MIIVVQSSPKSPILIIKAPTLDPEPGTLELGVQP